jgi:hypothetical protein
MGTLCSTQNNQKDVNEEDIKVTKAGNSLDIDLMG